MRTELGKTAVAEKNGKDTVSVGRRMVGKDVPTMIRHIRENETVYAVVTPVKLNG